MLNKYKATILKMAKKANISVEEALNRFILNLCVMKDQFEGFGNVNFRAAGQEWCKKLSSERNQLKKAFLSQHGSEAPSIMKAGEHNE